MCATDDDINLWIRKRTIRWTKLRYLEEHNLWQNSINDKLGGYLFARKMSARVPLIDFCTGNGPDELQHYVPPKDGRGHVVKDGHGYSSRNVFAMQNGFGSENLLDHRVRSLEEIQKEFKNATVSDIYVEELVQRGTKDGAYSLPDDCKFFTSNGNVASIGVVRNRGTDRACDAFYDSEWNRQDQFGCFGFVDAKLNHGNRTDSENGCIALR